MRSKKQREKLLDHKEQAFLSRRLVTIDTAVPVEFNADALKMESPDDEVLAALFQEYST